MRKKWNYERSGVFALGYIQNSNSYLSDISRLAQISVTQKDLDENIKNAYAIQNEINYYYYENGDLQSGAFDEKRTCRYAIETGFMTPSSNPAFPNETIYAAFTKDAYGKWSGVKFLTKFRMENMFNAYRFGNISFKNYLEANIFIKALEESLLPGETWKFKANTVDDYRPKTEFDILQSYLQYVFEKLLSEYNDSNSKNYQKIVFSLDGKYALYNSGLLNKFAQDIYLVGEVFSKTGDRFTFSNPEIAPSKVDLMRNYNFTSRALTPYPDVVEFFHSMDDIIYDSEVEIDLSFNRLTHIIEDGAKRNRFTDKYTVLYEKGDLRLLQVRLSRQSIIHVR